MGLPEAPSEDIVTPTGPGGTSDHPRIVYLLGGQGSQYPGMARRLRDGDAVFAEWLDTLDEVARLQTGRSVTTYLYDSGGDCDDLELSSLGLFMVEYALARSLEARGIEPDVVVGSSLGEMIAVAVVGAAPPESSMAAIHRFTSSAVRIMPTGGMVGVLGPVDEVHRIVRSVTDTAVAGVNSPTHSVISGCTTGLEHAVALLSRAGLVCVELPVRYPFHNPLMVGLRDRLNDGTARVGIRYTAHDPHVYSSCTAGRIDGFDDDHAWNAVSQPLRFVEAVQSIPEHTSHVYVDLTPSGSLSATLRASGAVEDLHPIITPFHTEMAAIERLVQHLRSNDPAHF